MRRISVPWRKIMKWLIPIIIVAVLIGISIEYLATAAENPTTPTEKRIAELLLILQKKDISDDGRRIIEENLAVEQMYATREAYYESLPKVTRSGSNPPISTPDPPRLIGIIEKGPSPFRSSYLKKTNIWQGIIFGDYVQVFAGALAQEPNQGIVIVVSETPAMSGGHYVTPAKSGAVRIIDEKNQRLVLEAENGDIFYFDILSLSFVTSMDIVVPSVTPKSTLTGTDNNVLDPYPEPDNDNSGSQFEQSTPYP